MSSELERNPDRVAQIPRDGSTVVDDLLTGGIRFTGRMLFAGLTYPANWVFKKTDSHTLEFSLVETFAMKQGEVCIREEPRPGARNEMPKQLFAKLGYQIFPGEREGLVVISRPYHKNW